MQFPAIFDRTKLEEHELQLFPVTEGGAGGMSSPILMGTALSPRSKKMPSLKSTIGSPKTLKNAL